MVTLLRYRYAASIYSTKKKWVAEYRGNDPQRTIGLVDIYGEHMRKISHTLDRWKPGEDPDWREFPQQVEVILEVKPHGMRIASCMGIVHGEAAV